MLGRRFGIIMYDEFVVPLGYRMVERVQMLDKVVGWRTCGFELPDIIANRDKVLGFVARADVQKQMETLGLTPANAADRVNAMTDEEVQRVAGKIDSLPAGAMSSAGWWGVGIVIIGLIVWYVYK